MRGSVRLGGMVMVTFAYLTVCASTAVPPFRVAPYIQYPTRDAVTVVWFSEDPTAGHLAVSKQDSVGLAAEDVFSDNSLPTSADALKYAAQELSELTDGRPTGTPFLHEIRVTGLESSTRYSYQVTQGGVLATGTFRTAGNLNTPVRLIAYADSETEPESSGKNVAWPSGNAAIARHYIVDQSTGYRENLATIARRKPDLVLIAGDLVESGGEQRDWDEFWQLNRELSASTAIIPALGNHEYYPGPDSSGAWATDRSKLAVSKYKTYFSLPPNGSDIDAHAERYYSLEYGPITIVVIDPTDGSPSQNPNDTNWRLLGENDGAVAPTWLPGSRQYKWLRNELSRADERSRFTFVMFHYSPYTSGKHGLPPGIDGDGSDYAAAIPLRLLTPLFMEYGVDVVLGGHDEMAEHSVVVGTRSIGNKELQHRIHFYDVGIGGDGLRAPHAGVVNPNRVFLAHEDSPEQYDDGRFIDGGKHYGHLEIEIAADDNGEWNAEIDFVYVFPAVDSTGHVVRFERRTYDNKTVIFQNPIF